MMVSRRKQYPNIISIDVLGQLGELNFRSSQVEGVGYEVFAPLLYSIFHLKLTNQPKPQASERKCTTLL